MIDAILINTLKHDISQVVEDAEKDALVFMSTSLKAANSYYQN